MIVANNLFLSFADRVILDDVCLNIKPGQRVALVGKNGAGKSTLLNALAKIIDIDSGKINIVGRVGLLSQVPNQNKGSTVKEIVSQGIAHYKNLLNKHQEICDSLKSCAGKEYEKLSTKLNDISNKIASMGGFNLDYRVEEVLTRLGILHREQNISHLSGGEKRRVDLAKTMLCAPDIFLLDEPTNHLDISAIQFLAQDLIKSNCAILFTSHDRSFIDQVATDILELDKGKLYHHQPPYSNYLQKSLTRMDVEKRAARSRERMMMREVAWLKAGVKARTTKQNARISRANELIDQVDSDVKNQQKRVLQIEQGSRQRLAKTILELDKVSFKRGESLLFDKLDLIVKQGDIYGVIGANGCGKTTLLSILSGKLKPTSGKIKLGLHTKIAFFDQHREELNLNHTLKQTLCDKDDFVFLGEHRIHIASYLERFLFAGSDMNRHVKTLSGGEKNRLLLAKLFLQNANCLFFDEPTNDLDIETIGVLEEALLKHKGVAFIVSHDRVFLDRVATAIIEFAPSAKTLAKSEINVYQGNYTVYQRLIKSRQEKLQQPDKDHKIVKTKIIKEKTKSKRSYKEQREYEQIADKINQFESEKKQLEDSLSSASIYAQDSKKASEMATKLARVNEQIDALYDRWEYLENLGG